MARLAPASALRPVAVVALGALIVAVAIGCRDGKSKEQLAATAPADDAGPPRARALDADGLAALAAVSIGTHRLDVVRREPDAFGAILSAGAEMAAVTITRCLTCRALETKAWEAERAGLAALMAPAPGDTLTIARVARGPWHLIELRARRTVEGVVQVLVAMTWNDGAVQLWSSCERAGADDAELLCAALVDAAALAYLPVLVPDLPAD